ncbi:hypothetical protein [Nocardioides sp. YIM 152588]|uniref:hypothetical protein n=1 Tax=Nocardioides sp. YIM 152588 TaxID=3158259 RepID=UPI0032E3D41E
MPATASTDRPRPRRRLTYANVVSTLALVVAVAGGGGAAVAAGLAKNSVSSPQIRNGQVKTVDLAAGAVTSKKVKNRSLAAKDIKLRSLGRGRVAASPAGPIVGLANPYTSVATVELTAPADGYVVLHGVTSVSAGDTDTFMNGRFTVDGAIAGRTHYLDGGDVDGLFDQSQAQLEVIPVTKGRHTYGWQLREAEVSTYASVYGSQLVVQFFPEGSIG